MAVNPKKYQAELAVPIEKVARLIRSFNRQEMAMLLQLVPELQTIRPDEVTISPEQAALMAYFDQKMKALPADLPPLENDIFLDNLTVAEFFALPEIEQDRLWQEAHLIAEQQMNNYEQPVRSDALPAR
jgi:hypothetical protein